MPAIDWSAQPPRRPLSRGAAAGVGRALAVPALRGALAAAVAAGAAGARRGGVLLGALPPVDAAATWVQTWSGCAYAVIPLLALLLLFTSIHFVRVNPARAIARGHRVRRYPAAAQVAGAPSAPRAQALATL